MCARTHAHLERNTSRDNDDLDTLEGLVELVRGVTLDLFYTNKLNVHKTRERCTTDHAGSVNVADISSDTGCTTDIIEAQGSDVLVELQEQRKRLANSSSGAEDGDLVLARRGRREAAGLGEGASSRAGEHGGRRVW